MNGANYNTVSDNDSCIAVVATSDWPMFRHDPEHTGYNIISSGPTTDHVVWIYKDTKGEILSSPAVEGGRVYIGSDDGKVYCLDADNGENIWTFQTGGGVWSSPAVADGRVYVGSRDWLVYCFGPEWGVKVSISPSYQAADPGSWLEYVVTVTNTGSVDDVYDLVVTDNLGWENIWLEDNSLWVLSGHENSTTLHIHIPENAENCTKDNVTVTAISRGNAQVSDNASCIAHAFVPVVEFTIDLVPDSWNLIGFPVTSASSTPENLLEDAAYYSMWKWDPAIGRYVKPPDDEPVELGVGYWLITDENTIKVPY